MHGADSLMIEELIVAVAPGGMAKAKALVAPHIPSEKQNKPGPPHKESPGHRERTECPLLIFLRSFTCRLRIMSAAAENKGRCLPGFFDGSRPPRGQRSGRGV